MAFRVKALPKAEADIRSITHYIHQRSEQGAVAWLNAYREARTRLGHSPESCAVAPESAELDIEVRQNLFKTKHGRV